MVMPDVWSSPHLMRDKFFLQDLLSDESRITTSVVGILRQEHITFELFLLGMGRKI